MKWGEYSSDVQFILQRSDQEKKASLDQAVKNPASSPAQVNESPKKARSTLDQPMSIDKLPNSPIKEQSSIRNSLCENAKTNEHRRSDLIGIVKGLFFNYMKNRYFFYHGNTAFQM